MKKRDDKKHVFVIFGMFFLVMCLVLSVSFVSASTTVTDSLINTTGNLTVGEKITFTLGEIIDNIVDSWIKITGNLNVTGNATVTGTSLKVNNQEVCLADGTNCQGTNVSYVSLYSSGNFNGSLYTTGANSSASDSNSIFQVIGSDGTPRFQVQDGGDNQASFISRSFLVVNQNSTRLNQSQNNLCGDWGFNQIDCNSSDTGADAGVQDDFEVQGLMFADAGILSSTSSWGSYLNLGNLSAYASGGVNGTFTDATDIFCDSVSDPFTQAQVNDETWIFISDGTYQGASALMKTFINTSCVKLSANPAWNADLTEQSFEIRNRPAFIISDGGFGGFYVGSDVRSIFEVKIENGSDFAGMHIDDTAGADQHKSLIIDTDANNHTGVLGINNFFRSSTAGDSLDLVGYYGEFSPTGIDNSDFSFMEFHQLGPKGTNNVRVFDIFGEYSELMRHEEVEVIDYVGYWNGASLINITANATSAATDMEIFSNDNDIIYFCDSVNLTEVAVNLQTPSSRNLNLEYSYYASDGDWKSLSVTDTTNGFTITGSVRWATPSDVNHTSTDKNLNAIGASYYCVAAQRTRNNVVIAPTEDFFSATGAIQFLLRDDLIKLTPASAPPITCSDSYDGAIYYDSDVKFHCSCNTTDWVQMNDYTTGCS
jgi:hypothetical protein